MPVKGKQRYQIYLDKENYDFVQQFLDIRRDQGGISGLLDKHLKRDVFMIKNNPEFFNVKDHGKMTLTKFINILQLKAMSKDADDII